MKRQRSHRVWVQKAFGKVLIDSIGQQEASEGFFREARQDSTMERGVVLDVLGFRCS